MSFARVVLWLSALAYAAVGVPFLLAPEATASLVELSFAGPTADNDVRAVYGGANLGVALFLLLASARRSWHEPALVLVMLSMIGLAATRVLSWTQVGLPSAFGLGLHGAEIAGAALAIAALLRLRQSGGPAS